MTDVANPSNDPDVHDVAVESDWDDPGLDPAHEYDEEPTWSAEAVHEAADADPDDDFVMADDDEAETALERRERLRLEHELP